MNPSPRFLIAVPVAPSHQLRPENSFDGLQAAQDTNTKFVGILEQEQAEDTKTVLLFSVSNHLETKAIKDALNHTAIKGGCQTLEPYTFNLSQLL